MSNAKSESVAARFRALMEASGAELAKRNAEIYKRSKARESRRTLARDFDLSEARVRAIVAREASRATENGSGGEPGAEGSST